VAPQSGEDKTMAQGFLSGIVWGGVVGVVGAGVVSVLAEGPVQPNVVVEAPVGTDAPDPGQGTTAEAVRDADLVREGDAPQVATPQADTVAAATQAGSDTPLVPETGAADDLAGPAEVADTGAVAVDDIAPVQTGVQALQPSTPGIEAELSISTDPAQPPAPAVPDVQTAFAPDAGDAPDTPSAEAPAPSATGTAPAPAVPEASEAPETPETTTPPAPVEVVETPGETPDDAQPPEDTEIAALAPEQETTGRPTIGRPAVSLVNRAVDTPEVADEAAEGNADLRPIDAYAAPFENPEAKPLMSIVLIDSGVDLTGGAIGLAALQSFPYPISFAVKSTLPDAAERAAEYRAQGFEVMAMIDLPPGATASDAEVSLSAALNSVPEAVAVMEGDSTGMQESRDASNQIAEAVLASGHGLVLQSKGLNTAQKLAARSGVPTGLIFRDFDSADQTPSVIRRFLDQAAFRAGQEGGVIMVGRVRPDTISALLLWGLQDRAERVALAPISAVLKTLAAQEQRFR
jgi:polysaccharide deacetylase 2 family uncharacterized protein YibQ